MSNLYIDLTKLDPEYKGGATRFAQGLSGALPEAVQLRKGDRPDHDSIVINPLCKINFFDPTLKHILCIHDIQHEVYPKNFPLQRRLWRRYQYRKSAKAAWKIQVSSNAIWRDLVKYMGVPSSKLFLAPEGYDEKLWSPDLLAVKPLTCEHFPPQFVYYPAGLWKHKNHKTVIEGLGYYGKAALVLTGKDYGELDNIRDMARRCGVELWPLGLVPEAQMRWLYKNAICTIAAGYYESGSLPLKEALACGGKVLAANIEPNMDLLGLPDLWHFETLSPTSFSEQLTHIAARNKSDGGGWKSLDEYRWSEIAKIYRQFL